MKVEWNITKEKAIKLINRHIHFLFHLHSTKFLKLQYVQMNLNRTIKMNCGFQLLKNGKNRNINTFIKRNFRNWQSFFNDSKYFNIKNKNFFLKKQNNRFRSGGGGRW